MMPASRKSIRCRPAAAVTPRPPSLVSVWSTAPLLLNNTVGKFEPQPSVEARMRSFNDSIEKLLWPEKRDRDSVLGNKVPGMIDRTTMQSYLRVYSGYLPEFLQELRPLGERFSPGSSATPESRSAPCLPVCRSACSPISIRSRKIPIPAKQAAHAAKVLDLLRKAIADLKQLPKGASDQEAHAIFKNLVDPLLDLSKCRDLVVNRGHYFGTGYSNPATSTRTPSPRSATLTSEP